MNPFNFFRRKAAPPTAKRQPPANSRAASFNRAARPNATGYEIGGNFPDLQGWNPAQSTTENALIAFAVGPARARARDLWRNTEPAAAFVFRIGLNAAPLDFAPRADLPNGKPDRRLRAAITAALAKQSSRENFTLSRRSTRQETERLIAEGLARDGEVLIRRHRNANNESGFCVELIDPAYLDITISLTNNPGHTILAGVETDAQRRAVAYHFRAADETQYAAEFNYQAAPPRRIPASEILHLFKQSFPNQIRGMPPLHAAAESVYRHAALRKAALRATQRGAALAVVIKQDGGVGAGFGDDPNADPAGATAAQAEPPAVKLDGTEIAMLDSGQNIDSITPDFPNAAFEAFIESELESFAASVGMSAVEISQKWGSINFAAGQLMRISDSKLYESYSALIRVFAEWWFRDWLRSALDFGLIRDNRARLVSRNAAFELAKGEWRAPKIQTSDPKKSAETSAILLAAGLTSRRAEKIKMGDDPDANEAEIEAENESGIFNTAAPTPAPAENPPDDDDEK